MDTKDQCDTKCHMLEAFSLTELASPCELNNGTEIKCSSDLSYVISTLNVSFGNEVSRENKEVLGVSRRLTIGAI